MKKVAQGVCLVLVLGLVAMGCGKKSELEGKVVDGAGKPVSGMKIMARQVQPMKGYEQFEATTGSDGSFKFSGLFPASEYTLLPWMQDTKFSALVNIQSGPEGETVMLPQPFAIRLMQTRDGIIKDSATGVQWLPDLERKDTTWDDAQSYVRGLNTGGFSDWRLPSRVELKSLHEPSIRAGFKIDPMFQLSNNWVWTGELDSNDPTLAWYFHFYNGGENRTDRNSSYHARVLAVRSPK